MKSGDFVGAKLELARTFRGLTQGKLADEVSASNAAISFYENGKLADPSHDLVDAWGEVLGIERDFFFEPVHDPFRDEECHFRHRQSAPEGLKKQARAFGTLVGMVVDYLKSKLELPAYSVPAVSPSSKGIDVERAAHDCRAAWGLGFDTPITNMGRVLENAGVPVVKTLTLTSKLDAFSRQGKTPIVLVNTNQPPSRTIFDLAHELGHLVCHQGILTGSMETEREADAFGSAFLLPEKAFAREFRSAPFSWEHMFQLKARWRVSLAAILYRAYSLSLIDALTYRRSFKYLSARGWRKTEPNEPLEPQPELLYDSIATLHHELGEAPSHMCKRLHFKHETFEQLTGIEPTKKKTPDVVRFERVN